MPADAADRAALDQSLADLDAITTAKTVVSRWPDFRAARDHQGSDLNPAMWQPYAARLEVVDLPMLHAEMTSAEASSLIAPALNRRMAQG